MSTLLSVAAGGAIGASARYLLGLGMTRVMGFNFPWGTLTVNIVGSFLMGLLIEYFLLRGISSPETRTFLATGILGGFTTFSAFSLDVAVLMDRKEHAAAALYMAGSVGISILMLYAGFALARQVLA